MDFCIYTFELKMHPRVFPIMFIISHAFCNVSAHVLREWARLAFQCTTLLSWEWGLQGDKAMNLAIPCGDLRTISFCLVYWFHEKKNTAQVVFLAF